MEHPDLSKFPPKLRRLFLYIAKSEETLSLSEYARKAGLSPNAVWVSTFRARQKGNDFNELIDGLCKEKIRAFKPTALRELQKQCKKGNIKALELFFKLSGDLREAKVESNTTQSLCFILPMPSTIENVIESPSENGHWGESRSEGSGSD